MKAMERRLRQLEIQRQPELSKEERRAQHLRELTAAILNGVRRHHSPEPPSEVDAEAHSHRVRQLLNQVHALRRS